MLDCNLKTLKSDFINCFGEEKWNAEVLMDTLWGEIIKISKYLGIEPIPVVIEDIKEDARFMFKEKYIIIAQRLVNDINEVRKCLIHELRHYYQMKLIASNDNGVLANVFREDFSKLDIMSPQELTYNTLEIDAFAFTKYIMNEWYKVDASHPVEEVDLILDLYISKYFI